jgi:hypothetical protein
MAAFDARSIAGQQVISFPPMVEALREQRRRLLGKRALYGSSEKKESASAALLSLSGVGVGAGVASALEVGSKKNEGKENCATSYRDQLQANCGTG